MQIQLRTVVYSTKVEIRHVPILSCNQCAHSEVFSEVKGDLSRFIGQLGNSPKKQRIDFREWNEWSYLISAISEHHDSNVSMHTLIEERIDQLLDLMLLAKSLGDERWASQITERLSQISNRVVSKQSTAQ